MFNKLKEAIALAEAKEFEENALEIISEDSSFDDDIYEFMLVNRDITLSEGKDEECEEGEDCEEKSPKEEKEECEEEECEEKSPKEEKDDKKQKSKDESDEEDDEDSDDKEDEDDEELDEACNGKKTMACEAFSDIFLDKQFVAKRNVKKARNTSNEVERLKNELEKLKKDGASKSLIEKVEKDLEKAQKKAYKARKEEAKSRRKVLGESSKPKNEKLPSAETIEEEMEDDVEIEKLLESICEDF